MSTSAPTAVPDLPSPPRVVPWHAALGAGRGWLLLGVALLLVGVVWLLRRGTGGVALSDPASPAAAPLGALVLPGLACAGLWWRAVLLRRDLLGRGESAPAEIVYQQPVRLPWPHLVVLAYRFVDAAGYECSGRQTEAEGSAVHDCVGRGGRGLVALHDPARPRRHLLVSAPALAVLVGT